MKNKQICYVHEHISTNIYNYIILSSPRVGIKLFSNLRHFGLVSGTSVPFGWSWYLRWYWSIMSCFWFYSGLFTTRLVNVECRLVFRLLGRCFISMVSLIIFFVLYHRVREVEILLSHFAPVMIVILFILPFDIPFFCHGFFCWCKLCKIGDTLGTEISYTTFPGWSSLR